MSAPDASAGALAKADKGERITDLAYPVRLSQIEKQLAFAAAQLQGKSFSEYVRVLINRDLKQGDTR